MKKQGETGQSLEEQDDEQMLRDVGKQIAAAPLPDDALLDAAIARGLHKAAATRRRPRLHARAASLAASLLLFAGLVLIRVSPAFAAYVGQVPLLKPLVELIQYDKGLKLAFENDFFQPIGQVQEHDGINVTVDGLIADEARLVVFISLENAPQTVNYLDKLTLKDGQGNPIPPAVYSYGPNLPEKKNGRHRIQLDIMLEEGEVLPDVLAMSFTLGPWEERSAESRPVWEWMLPVDKSKYAGKQIAYDLNQTVVVDGQRITFGKLTVYPTRIQLEVAYDPANTKRIFNLGNIRLEDEHGEVYAIGANGLISTNPDQDHALLYFQSSYFSKPKHLYLKTDGIRGLPKNQTEVQVDLEQKKLLSAPDERLTLANIGFSGTDSQTVLDFRLKVQDEDQPFSIFAWSFKDASGKSYDSHMVGNRRSMTKDDGLYHEIQFYLPKGEYQSPVTLTVQDYPSELPQGSFEVKIQ